MIEPVVGYFTKQPAEVITVGVDWTERLSEGESLASLVAEAVRMDDGSPAPDVLRSYNISGNITYATVQGGTDRQTYRITLRVTTNFDQTYEAEISMYVEEL